MVLTIVKEIAEDDNKWATGKLYGQVSEKKGYQWSTQKMLIKFTKIQTSSTLFERGRYYRRYAVTNQWNREELKHF